MKIKLEYILFVLVMWFMLGLGYLICDLTHSKTKVIQDYQDTIVSPTDTIRSGDMMIIYHNKKNKI